MFTLTTQSSTAAPGGMRPPVLTSPAVLDAAVPSPAVLDAAVPSPAVLDEPHVWLGLPADETCPGRIADAARRRLDAIRDAGGEEDFVKEALIAIIVAARQTLLARSRADTRGRAP